ncbi:transcription intermediary factor 1-beta-like [Mytilus edulis]|uniref:transcription intermediary factor 1-beta-like n=1 Tax=Mytilus edulis TaxID=6550 RepID=UPI0039EECE33
MDVNDDKDLCSPCKFEGKQKKATKWCTECDETLCTTCHENHYANMSSKEHHVILVVGKHMLQSLHIPLTEYCEDHEKEKDLYCSSYKEIICLTCSQTSHGKCEPAVRLREVYKNAKSSSVVSVLENDAIVVMEEVKDIIKDRENNKLQLEKQRTEILDTVKDIRKCINAQLDQY